MMPPGGGTLVVLGCRHSPAPPTAVGALMSEYNRRYHSQRAATVMRQVLDVELAVLVKWRISRPTGLSFTMYMRWPGTRSPIVIRLGGMKRTVDQVQGAQQHAV